jgi:hypothetical protein
MDAKFHAYSTVDGAEKGNIDRTENVLIKYF